MQKNQFGGLLMDFWQDLQEPAIVWQVAALALCLALAWLAHHLLRKVLGEESRFGQRSLKRLVFPLAALVFVLITRPLLKPWQSIHLLNLAVPLLVSFAAIRTTMLALRYGFPRALWLASFERLLTLIVWGIVALYVTGLLPEIIESLEDIRFVIGKQKLSLWLILQGAGTVLVSLLAALWLGGLIEQRLMAADGLDVSLKLVFARLSRAVLILLAVLISLPLVGIDLTALSVFGGALGVGIGLGLQGIAASYISGFIILLDRSIKPGHVINVEGIAGMVTHVTTRFTVLRSGNGIESIVPNEKLVGSVVQNETYSNARVRHVVKIRVGYGSDVERAMVLLCEAAHSQSDVLADPPPQALLIAFAESGIDLELGFWLEDPKAGTPFVKSALQLAIWHAFRKEGIEISLPQREVRLLDSPPGRLPS